MEDQHADPVEQPLETEFERPLGSNWEEMADLVVDSYCIVAPRRLSESVVPLST